MTTNHGSHEIKAAEGDEKQVREAQRKQRDADDVQRNEKCFLAKIAKGIDEVVKQDRYPNDPTSEGKPPGQQRFMGCTGEGNPHSPKAPHGDRYRKDEPQPVERSMGTFPIDKRSESQ